MVVYRTISANGEEHETLMNLAPELRQPHHLYIGGQWVSPETDARIAITNPATEDVFATVASASVNDIARAVSAAREAFDTGPWPRLSPQERAGWLDRLADGIDARKHDFAAFWSLEMGIVHKLASMMSGGISYSYRSYARIAEQFAFEEERPTVTGAKLGILVREPVGVVGAIVPWNAPAMLTATKVAPALAAGCTVILKASPEAPGHALLLAEIAEDIGLPAGVLNVVTADRGPSEALVSDERVDKISFTGSSAAGRRIASIVGGRMGRFTMELGGKSAALVLDDYSVEEAAKAISRRAIDMTGQVCAALTRIIVSGDRHDALVEAMAGAFAGVTVGNPFDPGTRMGPLATGRQRDIVTGHIDTACASGAKLVSGGCRPAHLERGFYIEPTVFGEVDPASPLAREEIFGPVLSVIPARDEAHAVQLANDTIFGLNNAVFTNDVDKAYRIARQLRSGTVGHNGMRVDYTIAFGGFKQSGVGREGGVEGLMPYLETKTVILQDRPGNAAISRELQS
jgi:betaine-aldehyde dehydrogenase